MSEVLRTVMQQAPYIGTSIGMAIGMVGERVLVRRAEEERQPLNEILGDVAHDVSTPSRINRIGARVLGTLALTCAVAGGANGLAWQEEGSAEDPTKLQLIVDKSGATASLEGDKSSSDSINEAIKKFRDEGDARAKIYVAVGGGVLEKTADQAIATRPFGDAPIGTAVQTSLDNIQNYSNSGSNTSEQSENAIVVFTNGNDIGDARTVVESAESTNTAIFVKDVYGSTDSSTKESIQKIAEETGGQYFDSTDKVDSYEDVKEKVKEADSENNETSQKHGNKEKALVAILSLLSIGAAGRARRKMPLTFSGTDIGK